MSRTYRRTGSNVYGWNSKEIAMSVLSKSAAHRWHWDKLDPDTKEYKEALAVYHSDKTSSFKEPGPSWFRNMFSERPMRRHNKRELMKFMRVPEYEPMVFEKYPLQYWT